jgi:hypothetical protein
MMILSLMALMAVSTAQAGTNPLNVIVLDPGYTEFSMEGQDFFCITPERIRIRFDGISPIRVYGQIVLLGEATSSPVKLVWVSAGHEDISLHDCILNLKMVRFDSVTGHNEKIE